MQNKTHFPLVALLLILTRTRELKECCLRHHRGTPLLPKEEPLTRVNQQAAYPAAKYKISHGRQTAH